MRPDRAAGERRGPEREVLVLADEHVQVRVVVDGRVERLHRGSTTVAARRRARVDLDAAGRTTVTRAPSCVATRTAIGPGSSRRSLGSSASRRSVPAASVQAEGVLRSADPEELPRSRPRRTRSPASTVAGAYGRFVSSSTIGRVHEAACAGEPAARPCTTMRVPAAVRRNAGSSLGSSAERSSARAPGPLAAARRGGELRSGARRAR